MVCSNNNNNDNDKNKKILVTNDFLTPIMQQIMQFFKADLTSQ